MSLSIYSIEIELRINMYDLRRWCSTFTSFTRTLAHHIANGLLFSSLENIIMFWKRVKVNIIFNFMEIFYSTNLQILRCIKTISRKQTCVMENVCKIKLWCLKKIPCAENNDKEDWQILRIFSDVLKLHKWTKVF